METLWAECRGQGCSPQSPMWWAEAMVLDTASQRPALPAEAPREVTFSPIRWVQCWRPNPHGVMRMALNSTHMDPLQRLRECILSPGPPPYPLRDSGRSLAVPPRPQFCFCEPTVTNDHKEGAVPRP